ncbi:MAG TPA: 2TM domain-containing protein [Pseudomonadales bacterium]
MKPNDRVFARRAGGERGAAPAGRRWLRRHALASVVLAAALLAANKLFGTGWWSFWPITLLGLALAVHFFVVRTFEADEGWVDQRLQDLRRKSYDFDHIRDIERRVDENDYSVTPSDRRAR